MKTGIIKCISAILSLALAMGVSITTYANEAEVTEGEQTEYEYLLNLGTPEEYLKTLTPNTIEFLYDRFYGEDVEFGGFITDSKEVTENSGVQTRGNIPTSELSLVASYFNRYNGNTVIEVTITAGYTWLKLPFWRMENACTLNWDSSLFYNSGVFYQCSAGEQQGLGYQVFEESTSPATSNIGGVGWYLRLSPSRYPQQSVTYLSGECTLVLKPKVTINKYSSQRGNITYNYAHKTGAVSLGFFFERSICRNIWWEF